VGWYECVLEKLKRNKSAGVDDRQLHKRMTFGWVRLATQKLCAKESPTPREFSAKSMLKDAQAIASDV